MAACFTVFVIIVNIIELSLLLSKKNRKRAYEKFLLSLTLADLLTTISSFIALLLLFLEKYCHLLIVPLQIWVAWSLVALWGVLIAVMHVICITLDRLGAIVLPFHHKVHVTGRLIGVVIALDWFLPFIVTLANLIVIVVDDMVIVKGVGNIFTFLVRHISIAVFIGDIACIISYSLIIMLVYRKSKPQVNGPSKEQQEKQQEKTFMLCFCVVFSFILSSAPTMVTYVPWNAPKWLKGLSLNLIATNF